MIEHAENGHVINYATAVGTAQEKIGRLQQRVAELEQANASLEKQITGYMANHAELHQVLQRLRAEHRHLHHERRMLNALLENSSEFIGMVSLEGQPLYLNAAGRALVGLASEDEFLATQMIDYVFSDDRAWFERDILPALQEPGRWEGELRFSHFQTGEAIPVYYSAFLVRDVQTGQPLALGTVTRDMRYTRHAKEELRQSRALLQGIIDNAPLVIYAKDPEGHYTLLNERAALAIGQVRDEALGQTDAELFPPDVASAFAQDDAQILATGAPIIREERVPQPEGMQTFVTNKFPLRDATGAIVATCGISLDISARKQVEEQLSIFKTVVETAPDGISVAGLDGVMRYANQAFGAMTGYGAQLVGKSFFELYAAEDQGGVTRAAEHVAQHGTWQGRLNLCRPDEQSVPVQLTSFVIRDEDGQPLGLTGIFKDMSAQQRADEERTILQQQVISAQRDAIRALSTPLIPLSERAVLLPLIGGIDSARAEQVIESLLQGVERHRAEMVILDITGVDIIDTQVANVLLQAAQATRLLGAQVILTGIQPRIAQTLVGLGVTLAGIQTRGTLQAGIAAVLRGRER